MMNSRRTGLFLTWITMALTGCGGNAPGSGLLSGPSRVSPSAPPIQPTVTAIAPAVGSTSGGAWGTITGSQFQSGAVVRLGTDVTQSFVENDSTIDFWSRGHAPGAVDVAVANPGGLASSLSNAFTFAPPESFDFTGEWVAYAGPEYEESMHFTVRNGLLVNLACGFSDAITLSPPPVIMDGAFSFRADDGVAIAGHLVSSDEAEGTINVPGCTATLWWGEKSLAAHTALHRRLLLNHP